MLALLRTRRWLGFTGLVAVVIIAFGLLSAWQWHRAEERRVQRADLQAAAQAEPIPLSAMDIVDAVPASDVWRAVSVTGTFDESDQVLVRRRPQDSVNGFWVMTPLRTPDGAAVWVNRGWVAAEGDARSTPVVPSPPGGGVSVIGYLRAMDDAEGTENVGLPAGQVAAPAAPLLPELPGERVSTTGYVQLADSTPAQEGLVPVPLPDIDEGRNVSYAVQWLLFAAIAVSGWYVVLRREAAEDRRSALVQGKV